MHIVLLNDDSYPNAKGGSALVAEWERQALAKRGYQVTLVTTHQHGQPGSVLRTSDAAGDILSICVEYPLRYRHRRCLRIPTVSAQLDNLFVELKPDITHAHTIHTYLTYDALRVAAKHSTQVWMTAHDTFAVSFGRVNSPRYRQDALQQKAHHLRCTDHLRAVGRQYWPLRNRGIRKAIADSGTKVVAVSACVQTFLEANGLPCEVVLYNGVPIAPSTKSASSEARPTILYGGRINADKGIGALLQAMEIVCQQVPNARLLVVGEQQRLEPHLANASAIVKNATTCTGWLPYDQMYEMYQGVHVVTTPSIYLDAFNLMNIEAMNAGKPVVGTCFGGTAEIVQDGVTGYVCNPLDTEQYAAALQALLTNPQKANTMGKAGRQRVETEFSLDQHINRLVELLALDR